MPRADGGVASTQTSRSPVARGLAASVDAPADWMRTEVLDRLARVATPVAIAAHEQRQVDLIVR